MVTSTIICSNKRCKSSCKNHCFVLNTDNVWLECIWRLKRLSILISGLGSIASHAMNLSEMKIKSRSANVKIVSYLDFYVRFLIHDIIFSGKISQWSPRCAACGESKWVIKMEIIDTQGRSSKPPILQSTIDL